MSAPDFEKIYTEYFSDVYKYVLSLCRVFVNKKVLQKGVKKVSTFNTQ